MASWDVRGSTTLGITTLSINGLFTTLSINDTKLSNMEYYYAECCVFKIVMLSVVMLNVIMLNVIMLNVMAPCTSLVDTSILV